MVSYISNVKEVALSKKRREMGYSEMVLCSKRAWRLGVASGVLAVVMSIFVYPTPLTRAASPSASFTRYDISASGGFAIGITVDRDGNPWFGLGNGAVGTIEPQTGKLKVYPLANPNAGVGSIKFDEDGNLWFPEANAPGLGTVNPRTGREQEFLLPLSSRQAGLIPLFVQIDRAGNIWFTEADFTDATGGKIGRLSKNGVITEWAVPTVGAEIEEIALDHQGHLWFAEQGNIQLNPSPNKVGVLNPDDQTIIEYSSPTPNSRPAGILVATDDTVWFSEHAVNKIAHLFPAQARGVVTHVSAVQIPVSPSLTSQTSTPGAPTHPTTTTAPTTTLISPVTHSRGIVEYSLPPNSSLANTEDMRFGPDGNLFFEDDAAGQIGELTLSGRADRQHALIHEWPIPQGVGFYNIEFDSQGHLWISDTANFGSAGSIYRFVLDQTYP